MPLPDRNGKSIILHEKLKSKCTCTPFHRSFSDERNAIQINTLPHFYIFQDFIVKKLCSVEHLSSVVLRLSEIQNVRQEREDNASEVKTILEYNLLEEHKHT